jgi:arabinose-5-phosphate isomerase
MRDAIYEMSKKGLGITAVVDDDGRLVGCISDGDLRRLLERVGDIRNLPLADVMTRSPLTIGPDVLAAEAAQLMDRQRKNQLLVVDGRGHLVGALNNLDLMNAKVI